MEIQLFCHFPSALSLFHKHLFGTFISILAKVDLDIACYILNHPDSEIMEALLYASSKNDMNQKDFYKSDTLL